MNDLTGETEKKNTKERYMRVYSISPSKEESGYHRSKAKQDFSDSSDAVNEEMHYHREDLKESLMTNLQNMLEEKSKFDVEKLIKK